MRVKIFNKGNGGKWYISCKNHKDDKDKAYLDLYFPNNTDPACPAGQFTMMDIDILEAKFTSYHNKVGMTVFKYSFGEPRAEGEPSQEIIRRTSNTMGGGYDGFDDSDLPF